MIRPWDKKEMAQVAEWLSAGWTQQRIADRFGISRDTVTARINRTPSLCALKPHWSGRPKLWTSADREKVAEMLRAGLAVSAIAKKLHLTRNAAMGRISRDPTLAKLLAEHGSPPGGHLAAAKPKPAPRQPDVQKVQPEPARLQQTGASVQSRPPKNGLRHIFGDFSGWEAREAEATRKPLGVPLVELGLCQCRWAVAEDPEHRGRHYFCGLAIRPGDTYCEPHRQKAVA